MDIFGLDLITILPWLIGVAGSAIIGLIIFFVYYQPKIQKPLPNEKSLDYWKIWLREHGVHTGYVTSAMQTLQSRLTEIIQNESEETLKIRFQEFQKILNLFSPIAQRFEGKIHIYLCTQNPEDQRFRAIDPDRKDGYILNGVEDVLYAGEWDDWQIYGVRLGRDIQGFTDQEKLAISNLAEGVKYLREAAKNKGKLREIQEELDDKSQHLEQSQKDLAKTRSELDRAKSALGMKPLTTPPEIKVPGALREKLKQWFSWHQILTASIGYLVAPYILQMLQWYLEPPATTYFTAFVTFIGFFIIPILKKLFGRWI